MIDEHFTFGNAAGTARTMQDFEALLKTTATTATIGSMREFKNPGNTGRTYFYDPVTRESGNALGVPEAIAKEGYAILLPLMVAKAHALGKKVKVSVHASSPDEYARLAAFAFSCGVDEVELNLSCPNERLTTGPQIIPCFDPGHTLRILSRVYVYCPKRKVDVKVSAIGNDLIPELVRVFTGSGVVRNVVGINTIPNQTFKNPDGSEGLDYIGEDKKRYHTGGQAGKPIADERRRVQEGFVRLLPKDMGFIAVGGIFTAEDVLECERDRARGVQTATALLETPPYGRIFNEWAQGF